MRRVRKKTHVHLFRSKPARTHPTFSSNYNTVPSRVFPALRLVRWVFTVKSCSSTHVTEYSRDGNIDNPRGSRRDATQERRKKKKKTLHVCVWRTVRACLLPIAQLFADYGGTVPDKRAHVKQNTHTHTHTHKKKTQPTSIASPPIAPPILRWARLNKTSSLPGREGHPQPANCDRRSHPPPTYNQTRRVRETPPPPAMYEQPLSPSPLARKTRNEPCPIGFVLSGTAEWRPTLKSQQQQLFHRHWGFETIESQYRSSPLSSSLPARCLRTIEPPKLSGSLLRSGTVSQPTHAIIGGNTGEATKQVIDM